jgi:hypothetical protein
MHISSGQPAKTIIEHFNTEAASCRPAADLRARAEARFKQNGISLMRLSNRAQARLGLH